MAFEGLTEKLSAAFKKLRGKGRLTEADVKEAMREIRVALLEASSSSPRSPSARWAPTYWRASPPPR